MGGPGLGKWGTTRMASEMPWRRGSAAPRPFSLAAAAEASSATAMALLPPPVLLFSCSPIPLARQDTPVQEDRHRLVLAALPGFPLTTSPSPGCLLAPSILSSSLSSCRFERQLGAPINKRGEAKTRYSPRGGRSSVDSEGGVVSIFFYLSLSMRTGRRVHRARDGGRAQFSGLTSSLYSWSVPGCQTHFSVSLWSLFTSEAGSQQ